MPVNHLKKKVSVVRNSAYKECVDQCKNGCDDVTVENPQLDVDFLIFDLRECVSLYISGLTK